MDKKVMKMVGCFLMMMVFEFIAVSFAPATVAFKAFMILALAAMAAFVLVQKLSKNEAPKVEEEVEVVVLDKAA